MIAAWCLGLTIAAMGSEQDARQADVLACEAGRLRSCVSAGEYLITAEAPACGDESLLHAGRLLMQACKSGDAASCLLLARRDDVARLVSNSFDAEAVRAAAIQKLLAQCEAGDAESCAHAGANARARTLREKACRAGDAEACERNADEDLQSPTTRSRGIAQLEPMCRLGREAACAFIAAFVLRRDTPKKLREDSEPALRVGCLRGAEAACSTLAAIARRRGHLSTAILWSDRACRAGSGMSCHMLADKASRGEIPKDRVASDWRTLGCDAGWVHATCPAPPDSCVKTSWPPGSSARPPH